jgi:hypothetical protein
MEAGVTCVGEPLSARRAILPQPICVINVRLRTAHEVCVRLRHEPGTEPYTDDVTGLGNNLISQSAYPLYFATSLPFPPHPITMQFNVKTI